MTTQTILKARIADDIARSDLTTQIGEAITDAINFYKSRRFYFSETRSSTWVTVAAQSTYTSADDADIPLFLKIDEMWLYDSSSVAHPLTRYDANDIEGLLDNNASTGMPYSYAYIERSFHFYPIPDGVYTIRPIGHIEKAAPATDGEASNVWMTEAFELIRCEAKWLLYTHVIKKPDMADLMRAAADKALSKLGGATTDRVASRSIIKTAW